jgi:hypothetical protein
VRPSTCRSELYRRTEENEAHKKLVRAGKAEKKSLKRAPTAPKEGYTLVIDSPTITFTALPFVQMVSDHPPTAKRPRVLCCLLLLLPLTSGLPIPGLSLHRGLGIWYSKCHNNSIYGTLYSCLSGSVRAGSTASVL